MRQRGSEGALGFADTAAEIDIVIAKQASICQAEGAALVRIRRISDCTSEQQLTLDQLAMDGVVCRHTTKLLQHRLEPTSSVRIGLNQGSEIDTRLVVFDGLIQRPPSTPERIDGCQLTGRNGCERFRGRFGFLRRNVSKTLNDEFNGIKRSSDLGRVRMAHYAGTVQARTRVERSS